MSTEIWPKMTLSRVLGKFQIPFKIIMRSTERLYALSRTNEKFRLRIRFRPGTRTAYKDIKEI